MMSADDEVLVERCLRGDKEAYRPLVDRYQRVLLSVAARMMGNTEDARDAAQSAFVKAYEKLETWDRRHKFFSWLYRILVNECLTQRRSRRPSEPLDAAIPGQGDPWQSARQSALRSQVRAAIETLAPIHREVVMLRHFGELTYEEIAETLGIPEKTVKSRLYEARQRLGQRLLAWSE